MQEFRGHRGGIKRYIKSSSILDCFGGCAPEMKGLYQILRNKSFIKNDLMSSLSFAAELVSKAS